METLAEAGISMTGEGGSNQDRMILPPPHPPHRADNIPRENGELGRSRDKHDR